MTAKAIGAHTHMHKTKVSRAVALLEKRMLARRANRDDMREAFLSLTAAGRPCTKAGIPVTKHGFAKTSDEARRIAEQIGGPVVIKSQVLSGGRMKAGGVKFADTPEEAAHHAEHILDLEIGGHMPRGVLVDERAAVKHEYYAGVVWDGIRKRPVMLFSDMGGIDIEQVAEEHPDHVARRHFSTSGPSPTGRPSS